MAPFRREVLLHRFRDVVVGLSDRLREDELPALLLERQDSLAVYYGPFDHLMPDAPVVVVGITPGRASMRAGLRAARDALLAGASVEEADRMGKRDGSFSNARGRLAGWLDEAGVAEALGAAATRPLIDGGHRLYLTAPLRYPVFSAGRNYDGYRPPISSRAILRRYLAEFAEEVALFPRSLFVPTGTAVARVCLDAGIPPERLLEGFPHPSNGPGAQVRLQAFRERRAGLAEKVARWRARDGAGLLD